MECSWLQRRSDAWRAKGRFTQQARASRQAMAEEQGCVKIVIPGMVPGQAHIWTCYMKPTWQRTDWLPVTPSVYVATAEAPWGLSCATMGSALCCTLGLLAQPALRPCSNPCCGWTGDGGLAALISPPLIHEGYYCLLVLQATCKLRAILTTWAVCSVILEGYSLGNHSFADKPHALRGCARAAHDSSLHDQSVPTKS